MSSLKQQQEKFQQQQARLFNLAAAQGPLPQAKPAVQSAPNPRPPSKPRPRPAQAAVKKTNDAPRDFVLEGQRQLQLENLQRAPIGSQLKRILEVLFEKKPGELTSRELKELTHLEVDGNAELKDALQKNIKIKYENGKYSYRAKHELSGPKELLNLVRKLYEGLPVEELKDSYPDVLKDLQEYRTAGQVWMLQNSETGDEIVYPNDPKTFALRLDPDIKALLRGVELPREFVDVEKELTKAGMKPATNWAKRREASGLFRHQQQRPSDRNKRRDNKRTKFTNTHLLGMLQSAAAAGPSGVKGEGSSKR